MSLELPRDDDNPFRSPEASLVGPGTGGTFDAFEFKRPRTLIVAMLWVFAVLIVIAAISDFIGQRLFMAVNEGGDALAQAQSALPQWGQIQILVVGSRVLLYLVTAVMWCFWINRAARNIRAFGTHPSYQFTPGWAVGWYFVPVLNLIQPYRVMSEVYSASDPNVNVDEGTWKDWGSVGIVGGWWAMYLGGNVLGQIVNAASSEETVDSIIWGLRFDVVLLALFLVLTLVSIKMIRRINCNQLVKAGWVKEQQETFSPEMA